MDDRYIKLSFKNAKLFPKNIKTKDFVTNLTVNNKGKFILKHSKRAEKINSCFKEPITVHQVSNMLHTLIGERPFPSFKTVFHSRNEEVFELANNSFIKITSPKINKKVNGEIVETFIEETIMLNKASWNSWSKPKVIHWFKIKKLLGNNFDKFIELLNENLEYNATTKPFEELINIYSVYGSKLDKTISFLKEINKTPIINFLTKLEPDRSEITRNSLLGETIVSGIDKVYVLDGEILVPFEQSFVDKLVKTRTRILDGGFVKIEGFYYLDELEDTSSFIKLSEISDEKY
jgi:hypothetical protein